MILNRRCIVRFYLRLALKEPPQFERQLVGFPMRNFIASYFNDESGASAAEYALILAIVGAGIAAAVTGLGTAISQAISDAAGQL